jgi:hypothetical protein
MVQQERDLVEANNSSNSMMVTMGTVAILLTTLPCCHQALLTGQFDPRRRPPTATWTLR